MVKDGKHTQPTFMYNVKGNASVTMGDSILRVEAASPEKT